MGGRVTFLRDLFKILIFFGLLFGVSMFFIRYDVNAYGGAPKVKMELKENDRGVAIVWNSGIELWHTHFGGLTKQIFPKK